MFNIDLHIFVLVCLCSLNKYQLALFVTFPHTNAIRKRRENVFNIKKILERLEGCGVRFLIFSVPKTEKNSTIFQLYSSAQFCNCLTPTEKFVKDARFFRIF